MWIVHSRVNKYGREEEGPQYKSSSFQKQTQKKSPIKANRFSIGKKIISEAGICGSSTTHIRYHPITKKLKLFKKS